MSPTITTKRVSICASCGYRIAQREFAHYTRETGAIHIECTGKPVARTNQKPARCSRCDALLAPGQGRLIYTESQRRDGTYSRKWRAECPNH